MAQALFTPREGNSPPVDSAPSGVPTIIKPQIVTGAGGGEKTEPEGGQAGNQDSKVENSAPAGLPGLPGNNLPENQNINKTTDQAGNGSETASGSTPTGSALPGVPNTVPKPTTQTKAPKPKTDTAVTKDGGFFGLGGKGSGGGKKSKTGATSGSSGSGEAQKKSPVRVVLVFLLLIVAVASALVFIMGERNGWWSEASLNMQPTDSMITNLTHQTFTLTFLTPDPVISSIQYGTNPNSLKSEVFDDRNKGLGDAMELYTSHHITITDLSPNTRYYFVIVTQNGTGIRATRVRYENNNAPFEITTRGNPQVTNQNASVFGNAYNAGQVVGGGLLLAEVGGSDTMSGLSNEKGRWRIGLTTLFNKSTGVAMDIKDSDQVKLILREPRIGGTSQSVMTTYANAKNGIDIDLTKTTATPSEDTTGGGDSGGSNQGSGDENGQAPTEAEQLEVIVNDEETLLIINDNQPVITGTTTPNTDIKLQVVSPDKDDIEKTVTSDENGKYTFDLATENVELSEGEHRVVETNTSTGEERTKTFLVTTAGGGDGGSNNTGDGGTGGTGTGETGSGNGGGSGTNSGGGGSDSTYGSSNPVTPTLTPSPSPTPEPTPTPTAEPTPEPSPVEAETPESGVMENTLFLLLTGVFFVCISMGSYLLIRKED